MATVQIDFLADISQSTKTIANFTKQTEKELSGLSSTFTSFARVATGALAAIGIGFSLKKAIDEAAAFENQVNGLRVALLNSGITTELATEQFLEYASALQNTTKFSDDAVLSTASLIQSISRLPTNQLQSATKAALDLSTALRIDLDSAARLVAKAAEGNVEAFKRYGIEIQKGKDDTETFANTLAILESRFGGSAERAVNTFSGAIAQLQNAANDSLKAFGGFITQSPEVIAAIQTLTGFFVKLTDVIKDQEGIVQRSIRSFAQFITDLDGRKAVYAEIEASIKKTTSAQLDLNSSVDESIKQAKAFRTTGRLAEENAALERNKKAEAERTKLQAQAQEEFKKTESAFKSLEGKFQNFDLNPVQVEINKTNESLKALEAGRKAGLISGQDFEALRLKITQDGNARVLDAEKKLKDKQLADQKEFNSKIGNVFVQALSSIQQGSEGVAGFAAFGAGAAAESFLPGSGAAVSSATRFLAQDPELVRAQIQGFIDGIPLIIDNFTKNIPVILDVLAANIPIVATSLANQMPVIATRFGVELVKQSPNIAKSFADSLVAQAGRIVDSIVNGIKGALSFGGGGGVGGGLIGGLLGGGIGATIGAIGKGFKFADGGPVPGGAPFTDRIPALLTPGEFVLSRDDVKNLVNNTGSVASQQAAGPQMITINLQVSEEKLATVLFDLNRRGFRTA